MAFLLIALPLWLCSWTNEMLWDRNDERGVAALWVRQGTIAWFRQPMPFPGDHHPCSVGYRAGEFIGVVSDFACCRKVPQWRFRRGFRRRWALALLCRGWFGLSGGTRR
jgi:hypothetical protein